MPAVKGNGTRINSSDHVPEGVSRFFRFQLTPPVTWVLLVIWLLLPSLWLKVPFHAKGRGRSFHGDFCYKRHSSWQLWQHKNSQIKKIAICVSIDLPLPLAFILLPRHRRCRQSKGMAPESIVPTMYLKGRVDFTASTHPSSYLAATNYLFAAPLWP